MNNADQLARGCTALLTNRFGCFALLTVDLLDKKRFLQHPYKVKLLVERVQLRPDVPSASPWCSPPPPLQKVLIDEAATHSDSSIHHCWPMTKRTDRKYEDKLVDAHCGDTLCINYRGLNFPPALIRSKSLSGRVMSRWESKLIWSCKGPSKSWLISSVWQQLQTVACHATEAFRILCTKKTNK